ncbi:hypothetical protein MUP05_01890 [Candidatus Bathyarchaeota archaeon]|nr:hypothetical protein [Candidatus Bathyarchaeota archaeon]
MSIRPPEVWAAHEYAVIGSIFFFLFTVLPLLAISLLFVVDAALVLSYVAFWTGLVVSPGWILPITMGFGIFAIIVILVFIGAYITTVKRIDDGLYEAAKTPCLIMGILGLLVCLIVPGIFYMMAYTKLGEVILRYGPVASRTVLTPVGLATT